VNFPTVAKYLLAVFSYDFALYFGATVITVRTLKITTGELRTSVVNVKIKDSQLIGPVCKELQCAGRPRKSGGCFDITCMHYAGGARQCLESFCSFWSQLSAGIQVAALLSG
jgi:hypothetical protein